VTTPTQLPLEFDHRSALGATDFLVADSNRDAVEWIDRWPDWPGPALAVHGPAGCGKSHLAAVFSEKCGARPADIGAIVAPGPGLEGIWLIDGMRICLATHSEETVLHFFNAVVESGGSMLLIEREAPSRWAVSLPDLRSRLNAVSAVEILPPDDSLLAAVLVKLLADRQLRVSTAVIDYVLLRMERSFAACGALVEQLDRLALAERREITVPLARRVLDENLDGG
jgi:chromosomal replication initiation ATPase DnaA